ncbi:hypothetical protein TUM17561_39250 [Enterobacter cloacae]|nr:hypothetical protein TUM17561_39250 [Enterobacter cloacae]
MLVHFAAHRVTHLAKGKLTRLLACRQAVIGHTGFAKRFRHFCQMFFALGRGRRHAEIGQIIPVVIKGVLCLLHKGIRRTVNGSDRNEGE